MATTLEQSPTPTAPRRAAGPVACGAATGAVASVCCSVGILPAVTWATVVTGGYFSLSATYGSAILVFGGFALSALVAWLIMRRRTAGLPQAIARSALRRGVGASLLASAASYFVLMELVLPFLMLVGILKAGQFTPLMHMKM